MYRRAMTRRQRKRCAVYCRISQDDGTALGVQRQERECRTLAAERGLEVVALFVDNDVSAYAGRRRRRRPGFDAMIAAIADGKFDTIVCWHPDRLTRSVAQLEEVVSLLDQYDVDVLTVSAGVYDLTTPSGRMVARLLGATAQYESEHKAERIRAKVSELALKGAAHQAPVYGYRHGRRKDGTPTLAVEPTEAKWIRYMVKRAGQGASLYAIGKELEARGVPTRQGRTRWESNTVKSVLLKPTVAGLRAHRGELLPGNWTPIVQRDDWEVLCAQLAPPHRRTGRRSQTSLLSGMVHSTTGYRMYVQQSRGRRGYGTRRSRPEDGGGAWVHGPWLEDLVVRALFLRLAAGLTPKAAAPTTTPTEDLDELRAEKRRWADKLSRGEIDGDDYLAIRRGLAERIAAAEALQALDAQARAAALGRPTTTLAKAWPRMTHDARHRALKAAIRRVVVAPAGQGNRSPNDAKRVDIDWVD